MSFAARVHSRLCRVAADGVKRVRGSFAGVLVKSAPGQLREKRAMVDLSTPPERAEGRLKECLCNYLGSRLGITPQLGLHHYQVPTWIFAGLACWN